MRTCGIVAAALIFAAFGVTALAARAAAASRPNVILILVDTLRADHLSTYGYARKTSPNIDRFFAGGVVFESSRSQASCTFPSANSLLTSRDALEFVGKPYGEFAIPADFRSIAEILRPAGYKTIAVSASPIVRKSPSEHNKVGGFDRGFDVFDEFCLWREARCVNERALNALAAAPAKRPFFLYLHYMEPHDTYAPPQDYKKRFAGPYEGLRFIAAGDPNPLAAFLYAWDKKANPNFEPFDPEKLAAGDLAHLVALYDDEIGYFDSQFGELLRRLGERGLLDGAVVALVADHGEQFLEHHEMKHCMGNLFDEVIRTPFLLHAPGARAGLRVKPPVANLDLVPTLLDYAGVEGGPDLEGLSLRALASGRSKDAVFPKQRYVFGAQARFHSATDGRFKLLIDTKSGEKLLFDLTNDPAELKNLATENEREVARLSGAVDEWVDRVANGKDVAERLRNAEAVQERLRALGYLP